MGASYSLIGQRFGRLVVTQRDTASPPGKGTYWQCRCDCGAMTVAKGYRLVHGQVKSCGCLRREMAAARTYKHGATHTPEFRVWTSMKNRCVNPRHRNFANYGGRGIRVCERWANSFAAFLSDMGERPSPQHSLERVDNMRGYEPRNCIWATQSVQNGNLRTNHNITYQGRTLSLSEWSRQTGLGKPTLRKRLMRLGWSVDRALTTPARGAGEHVKHCSD